MKAAVLGKYIGWMLLISQFMACCPDVDQKLQDSMADWTPYQQNQLLSFKNENLDSITFKVKQRQRLETGHDQVCGSYAIQTAETLLIDQADTAFQFKITLTQEVLLKLDSYYRQPPAHNVSAMFNSVSEQFVSHDWRDRFLKEITLNGITYQNVLHIYGNNVPSSTAFVEIYYAKEVGLIGFSNAAGRFYRQ